MTMLIFLLMFQENGLAKPFLDAVHSSQKMNIREAFKAHHPQPVPQQIEHELNDLGYEMIRNKNLPRAIQIFELNIELFPQKANPYDSLAEAYLHSGEPLKSASFYKKAFEIEPDRWYWDRMGVALRKSGQMDQLLEYAIEGPKHFDDGESHDILFSLQLEMNQIQNPPKLFSDLVQRFPKHSFWRSYEALEKRNVSIDKKVKPWPESDFKSQGLKAKDWENILAKAKEGEFGQLEGLVIIVNNKLVAEAYFHGFNRWRPHDTRSVGKSITSLIAGIAIDQNAFDLETPLFEHFAQYRDPQKKHQNELKLKHLLGMTSGLNAFDNRKSPGNENYYQSNEKAWFDHVMKLDMAFQPGTQLVYASANYLVVGDWIGEAVKVPMDEFADRHLFSPLGIEHINWFRSPNGKPYGAGGIRISPRDLAKIGNLVLNEGQWNGKQIVSKAYIQHLKTPLTEGEAWGKRYGLGWYVHREKVGEKEIELISAAGNGGQRIWVFPELKAVAVVTMGHYNSRLQAKADELLRNFVTPALVR